ncbi:two-component regulator propeller domain-containing protein [bacterium]
MKIKKVGIYLLFVIIPLTFYAQSRHWEWKTFTSTREIRDMTLFDDQLWCATEGGLLLFDIESHQFEAWTNTEGVASVNVTSLCKDDSNNLWIGMKDGYLQRFDIQKKQWLTVTDYTDYHIYDLVIHGDSLFVALDIGISVYLISRQEVKETYKHLGEAIEAEIAVYSLLIQNNELWAITDQGISHTQLSHPNLLDPQFWQNETEVASQSSNQILSIAHYKNTYWLGTERGIYQQMDDGSWEYLIETVDIQPIDFKVYDDILYVLTEGELYQYDGISWISIASNLPKSLSLDFKHNMCFIGTQQGIYAYSDDLLIGSYIPDGPGGNFFSDLAVDQDGALWCCSSDFAGSSGNGFFKFSDDTWQVFNRANTNNLDTDLAVSVAIDQNNRKWIGTWGKGVVVLENDTTFTFYRPENGYLTGIIDGTSVHPNYAVVKDITVDLYGTIWILNRQAYNGLSLVSVTSDGVWTYYGAEDGISDIYLWNISVDQFNRKWIGSSIIADQAEGVFVYDDYWTPTDKSDDTAQHFNTGNGLLSKNVQAVAVDENNTVWLGSDLGLNYFNGSEIMEQYDLPSVNVQTLLIDGANNLWVGTNKGLYFYSSETFEWTSFNKENSDLVHDDIISLALDPITGYIYIGTIQGLSRLKSPFSAPQESFSQLRIYPNPFIINEHEIVSIENLARDVSVSIFSSHGNLVFQRLQDQVYGNTFIWNGKDTSGRQVPTGIYLIAVNNQKGEKLIGKLAVIR